MPPAPVTDVTTAQRFLAGSSELRPAPATYSIRDTAKIRSPVRLITGPGSEHALLALLDVRYRLTWALEPALIQMTPGEVQDGIERASSAPIQDDVTARPDHIPPLAWAECCGRFRYGGGGGGHSVWRVEIQAVPPTCPFPGADPRPDPLFPSPAKKQPRASNTWVAVAASECNA